MVGGALGTAVRDGAATAAAAAAVAGALVLGALARAPHASPGAAAAACGGVVQVRGALASGATRRWPVCFRRSPRARLRVVTDGHGDLDCYLYGPRHALVARDDDDTSGCTLDWTPRDSGTYWLDLVNAGLSPTDYSTSTK